ncbi:acid protease [Hesseltinella vesiculosa]|uniref:Acid protease n=1 Tax=Hesseltinella vesiculosa TaxID=101127 RepID=A0A1X2GR02_9FUNG|nr:acid protease [Hesseltinella vesiculosa]
MRFVAPFLLSTGAFALASAMVRVPVTKKATTLANRGLTRRDGASLPLYNDQSMQYIVNLQAGTPPKPFDVIIDTGSVEFWLATTGCPQSVCPVPLYNPSSSSTANVTTTPAGIQYGLGSANGNYVTDTVSLGGLTIQKQQFIAVTNTTDTFVMGGQPVDSGSVVASGLMGLAFDYGETWDHAAYPTIIDNLMNQKLISQAIFSIYLNFVNATGWSGEIIFGGIDSTKYTGQLSYAQVNTYTVQTTPQPTYIYWTVMSPSLTVMNNSVSVAGGSFLKPMAAMMDTGTTMSYIDVTTFTTIQKVLGAYLSPSPDSYGNYKLTTCNIPTSLTVQMGLLGSLQNSGASNSSNAMLTLRLYDMALKNPDGSCTFGFSTMNYAGGGSSFDWLLGDTFLRNFYLVFDYGNYRIGFASAVPSASSTNGPTGSGSGQQGGSGGSTRSAANLATTASLFVTLVCVFLSLHLTL